MILDRLNDNDNQSLPKWVKLTEACAFKGVAAKTVYNNRELMLPEHLKERVGHKDKWHREVILEWSQKTDTMLETEAQCSGLKVAK